VFQEGLNHNPDDIKLALSLADLYEQQGSFEAAVEIYEALLTKVSGFKNRVNILINI
jgi:thioredoxin-like negative regulator of GroEL